MHYAINFNGETVARFNKGEANAVSYANSLAVAHPNAEIELLVHKDHWSQGESEWRIFAEYFPRHDLIKRYEVR